MGRIPTQSSGDRLTSAIWNNLRADYLSQTDTTLQNILSSLDFPAGKRPKFPFAHFNPTTAPAATEGHLYADSTANLLKFYDGTNWLDIPGIAGGGGTYKLGASYTIYVSGGTYYAMDTDGNIDYSGATFATVINNAITDLNTAGGGTVHLKPGTYQITDALAGVIRIKSNVVVEGEGIGTIIMAPVAWTSGNKHACIENFNHGAVAVDSHIVVRDLQVDGNGHGSVQTFSGVDLAGVQHCQAFNVYSHDFYQHGIIIRAPNGGFPSKDNWIINCRGIGNYNNGLEFSTDVQGANSLCYIVNSYAEDNDTGMSFYGCEDGIITGCLSENNNNNGRFTNFVGIALQGDPAWALSKNVAIANCVSQGNDYNAIYIHNTYEFTVANNICSDGNDLIAVGKADPCFEGLIINNIVENYNRGIYVTSNNGRINIIGNYGHWTDKAGANKRFIHVQDAVFCNIIGNYGYDVCDDGSAGSGIRLQNGTNCVIADNFLYASALTRLNYGIRLTGTSNDNIIKNNYVHTSTTAISIEAGATDNYVNHNRMVNCTNRFSDAGTRTKVDNLTVPAIFDDSDVGGQSALSNIGDHMSIGITDDGATDTTVRFNFVVPEIFQEVVSADLYVVSLCTGGTVMRWNVTTDFGTADEAYNVHSDSVAATDTTMAANAFEKVDLAAALTGVLGDDRVGVAFIAEASHVNYTLGAVLHIISFTLRHV